MTSTDTGSEHPEIIDAHHHIWPLAELPWLGGEMVPRIFGPYEPIQRDYLAEEYIAEARESGISAGVYVQCNWPLDRSVDEVAWVHEAHERTGWPMAIIGSADLFDDAAAGVFEAQLRTSALMRGTRLQLHWHEKPEFVYASAPDRMHDPTFRRNIGRLADLDWLFELQVFAPQMQDATRLVSDFPEVDFVLVHAGMLESLDPTHVGPWETGMQLLAEQPNVVVKLTGQGTFVHRVDEELIRFVARRCLEWFGPRRCMFGTNFPVEKLWTDMPSLVDTWHRVLADEVPDDLHEVLAGTARRTYRI